MDGRVVREPERTVRAGNQLCHRAGIVTEPFVATALELLHNDSFIVAVGKPAPLPVHPCGRYNKNTALHLLALMFPEEILRPVHRLDADTTGVWVLAKSRDAARMLAQQFEYGEAQKVYLARVHGTVSTSMRLDQRVGSTTLPAGARQLEEKGLSRGDGHRTRPRVW